METDEKGPMGTGSDQDRTTGGAPIKLPAVPIYPICPHCKADPIYIVGQTFNVGPLETLLLCCRDCRVLLKVVEMGLLEAAQPARGANHGGIVIPS